MAGKSTRDIKLKGFSAIAAIGGGSLLLIATWSGLGPFLSSQTQPAIEASVQLSQPSEPVPQAPLRQNSSPPETAIAQKSPASNQPRSSGATRQGLLRVSNPSAHPVRVALLLKKLDTTQANSRSKSIYEPPAHWDFAPGEGHTKGLLLSLPNRSVSVKQGDVLVAFAQDGSRRYWGPFVIGETEEPNWNATTQEWELALLP